MLLIRSNVLHEVLNFTSTSERLTLPCDYAPPVAESAII